MYDELTEVDVQKMQEELHYRRTVLRPQLIEEVQTARASGTSARTMSTSAPSRPRAATRAASAT